MIRRREFIAGLGGAAAWPRVVRAQPPALPVVGYLSALSPDPVGSGVTAWRKGLMEAGFIEGRNIQIEYRWAENKTARLPELAADLVRSRVAVIIAASGYPTVMAAKAATTTIPIVFTLGIDPVERGLVRSLNRPDGNVTGTVFTNRQATGKRLGLLHEMVPGATRFALFVNSDTMYEPDIANARAAAEVISGQIEVAAAADSQEIDMAFASFAQKRAEAVMINASSFFASRRVQIAVLAARYALPAIYFDRQFAEAGGLMSYGSDIPVQIRQAGAYVGRILKGEKPADLPVLLPTKFEFVINLQTARTLGLTVPPTLLALADEVIE
jgi:putative tryptophan/tyrosine transport system substrate-binding protein